MGCPKGAQPREPVGAEIQPPSPWQASDVAGLCPSKKEHLFLIHTQVPSGQ